jgi:DNA-binding response OmpR family regulator
MKNILVVDDDEGILEAVQLVLEMEGYQVQTSLDGSSLRQMSAELPDLVLLDVLLSGEDGRDICRQLKASERTKMIPVILFSAHIDISSTFKMYGADDFLTKPFSVEPLIAVVKKYLE